MAARRPVRSELPVLHVAEPPAAYGRRPLLVADASMLAAALFREERSAIAVEMLQVFALAAPHLIDYEIGNVALKKLRRRQIAVDELSGALDDFAALDLARHPVDLVVCLTLAQRYSLSVYDAAYLWLAEALTAPLATFDDKLAAAARRHLANGDPPPA